MKKLFALCCVCLLSLSGCEEFVRDEIAELHSEIDVLKQRLEELCEEMLPGMLTRFL